MGNWVEDVRGEAQARGQGRHMQPRQMNTMEIKTQCLQKLIWKTRYSRPTHAVLQMMLSFAAETVTVPMLQSREISYRNTKNPQQNHALKSTQ